MGKWDDSVVFSLLDAEAPNQGFKLTFTNGERCAFPGGSKARTMDIRFMCPGPTPRTLSVTEVTTECTDIIEFPTDAACPAKDAKNSALSAGWLLIILMCVFTPVYIVVGCCYKSLHKGTRGTESCPNIDFWAALPGLVKDGCKYSYYMCLSGCKHGGRAEELYDEL